MVLFSVHAFRKYKYYACTYGTHIFAPTIPIHLLVLIIIPTAYFSIFLSTLSQFPVLSFPYLIKVVLLAIVYVC